VSGGTYQVADDVSPSIASGFTTSLDLSPVFAAGGGVGPTRVLPAGRALRRALAVGLRGQRATQFDSELDVMTSGRYVMTRMACHVRPARARQCACCSTSASRASRLWEVSCRAARPGTSLSYGVLQRMTLSTNVAQSNPRGPARRPSRHRPQWARRGSSPAPSRLTVTVKAGAPQAVMSATLNVTVTRGAGHSPNTWRGRSRSHAQQGAQRHGQR
jgi:hypothetical protein